MDASALLSCEWIHKLLQCKFVGLKIWRCKILDKYHVCILSNLGNDQNSVQLWGYTAWKLWTSHGCFQHCIDPVRTRHQFAHLCISASCVCSGNRIFTSLCKLAWVENSSWQKKTFFHCFCKLCSDYEWQKNCSTAQSDWQKKRKAQIREKSQCDKKNEKRQLSDIRCRGVLPTNLGNFRDATLPCASDRPVVFCH